MIFHKVILLCFYVLGTYVIAQNAESTNSDMIEKITGGSQKEWTVTDFDIRLGSSDTCTQGEIYTFYSDSILKIKTCNSGNVVTEQYTWTIISDSIDSYLSFNKKELRVIHSKKENDLGLIEEELVLRDEGSHSKVTGDLILTYIE